MPVANTSAFASPVVTDVPDTAFGKIAHLTQVTVDVPSPLQKEIATLSRLIAVLAVSIGLVIFVIGQFIGLK